MVKMMKMEFIDLEWIFIITKLELENFVKKNAIRANLKLILILLRLCVLSIYRFRFIIN